MPRSQRIALSIAGLMTISAVYLIASRGGLIAWIMLIAGTALLVKSWVRPAPIDPVLTAASAVTAALIWAATFYYVIATWESGEVVELTINTSDGAHSARVWILDIDGAEAIYYDADPGPATALLAGVPLQLHHGGSIHSRIPDAATVESLSEEQANKVLEAMVAKYGDRVDAAGVFYLLLGRPRDRQAVIAWLNAP